MIKMVCRPQKRFYGGINLNFGDALPSILEGNEIVRKSPGGKTHAARRSTLALLVMVSALCTYWVDEVIAEDPIRASKSSDSISKSSNYVKDEIHDPFEGWNRGVFWFNDKLDRYLLEPVASGYDTIVPDPVQTGVSNVFENIKYPSYLVSDLIQLKFDQVAEHTGRFLINSTLGLAGIFDVAKHFGLEHHQEDFGSGLAYQGVPSGPYIVVPILGPTTMRDGFGKLIDRFLDPVPWTLRETSDSRDAYAIGLGVTGLELVQTRADLIDAVDAAKDASVDYYLFIQSAYYQNREAVINDKAVEKKDGEEEDPFAEDEEFDEEFGDS